MKKFVFGATISIKINPSMIPITQRDLFFSWYIIPVWLNTTVTTPNIRTKGADVQIDKNRDVEKKSEGKSWFKKVFNNPKNNIPTIKINPQDLRVNWIADLLLCQKAATCFMLFIVLHKTMQLIQSKTPASLHTSRGFCFSKQPYLVRCADTGE